MKVSNDFSCDKGVLTPVQDKCSDCPYYYRNMFNNSKCLKEEVKYWYRYHIKNDN
jgi:hypothetical protein